MPITLQSTVQFRQFIKPKVAAGFILGCILCSSVWSQGMVPSNILTRVFHLKVGNEAGTGFTVEVDGRQYLITARHLLPSSPPSGTIEVFRGDAWQTVTFQSVQVEPASVDIAVLALPIQLSPTLPVRLGFNDCFLSQTVFFLGFPYNLTVNGHDLNNGFPLPIVKHGIIAGFGERDEPFLVDGINNPGFSGGPVVISDQQANAGILGVVSAYRVEQAPVLAENVRTSLAVNLNTGLLVAYRLDPALNAIRRNPIGFRLP